MTMKIDLRILVVVTLFLAMGASLVVITEYIRKPVLQSIREVIPPKGTPTSGDVISNLKLSINATALILTVANCDATAWQDHFFVHVYTDSMHKNNPNYFVNMDFNLKEEISKLSQNRAESPACSIVKDFSNFKVRAVSIGQFGTSDGVTYVIPWSRFYVFDSR